MSRTTSMLMLLSLLLAPGLGFGSSGQLQDEVEVLTLEELERRAMDNNPTLVQARDRVRAAAGLTLQAGLYPNPKIGYLGEELTFRAPGRTSEHLLVVEQSLVTAGKLRHRRSVARESETQVTLLAEAQRFRVLTDVRSLFYQSLASGRLVEFRGQLVELTNEAVEITRQLVNNGAADRGDLLEAEIEARRALLVLETTRQEHRRTRRQLAAVVGDPAIETALFEGSIDETPPQLQWEETLSQLLGNSPELASARTGVDRAEAFVRSAKAERVPDIMLRSGVGYNLDRFELGDDAVGMEAFVEAMVELPLFDRNQGNIAAAEALRSGAQEEVRRAELALRARLAAAFSDYEAARIAVDIYRIEIIPNAEEAHDLYLVRYRQMAAAYPQVLIARRTLLESQVDWVAALNELWRSATLIRGLLLNDGLSLAPGGGLPGGDDTMTSRR